MCVSPPTRGVSFARSRNASTHDAEDAKGPPGSASAEMGDYPLGGYGRVTESFRMLGGCELMSGLRDGQG